MSSDFGMDFSESPEGSYAEPDDTRCCMDRVAVAIQNSNTQIATAINAIAINIGDRVKGPCDQIELCIDKILDGIKERIEGPLYSCQQCRTMLINGMAGTLEYAIHCASRTCQDAERVCSAGDPDGEGKPCSGCGKEPCCCHQGTCEPCEEEQQPAKKYVGWCNPFTQSIQVTRSDSPAPGPPWIQVALSDTEQAAATEAAVNCKRTPVVTIQPAFEGVPRGTFPSPGCDIRQYSSQAGLEAFTSQLDAATQTGGFVQATEAVGNLGVGGLTLDNFGDIIQGLVKAVFAAPGNFIKHTIDSVSSVVDCTNPAFSPIVQVLMNMGMVQKYVGVDLTPYLTKYQYALNAICRQKHLEPQQSMAAYLGNAIDDATLDTLWGMYGACPEAAAWYKQAVKSKPTPFQLSVMRHRGIIDPPQYHIKMREVGYLDAKVSEQLFDSTYQIPTMSDITRLMVRDADDDVLAQRLGLDDYFDQKFQQQLKDWTVAQGIPEKFMRYFWRAHWTIPAPGQLFNFWHRLRDNKDFGGRDKLWGDIKAALIQQDILPYWHNHYLAISYVPMGRIDIRRAYNVGTVKDDELVPLYNQLGYSDDTSAKLAEFTRRLRDQALAGHRAIKLWLKFALTRDQAKQRLLDDGLPNDAIEKALSDASVGFGTSSYAQSFVSGYLTRTAFENELKKIGLPQADISKLADRLAIRIKTHPAIDGFAVGSLSRGDALAEMTTDGMNSDVADRVLTVTERKVTYALLARCQNGIKQRFLSGELTKVQASNELVSKGTVKSHADKLSDEWDCEKSAIGRAIPTAQLCTLLEQGVITANDFNDRLVRIGYTRDNARLIVDQCLRAIGERRLKMQQQQEKQFQQRQRAEANAQLRAQRLLEREANKLESARIRSAAARKMREKQLMSAAQKLFQLVGGDLYGSIGAVRLARDRIMKDYPFNIDETLQILIKAADTMPGFTIDIYNETVTAMAETALQAPPDPLAVPSS